MAIKKSELYSSLKAEEDVKQVAVKVKWMNAMKTAIQGEMERE